MGRQRREQVAYLTILTYHRLIVFNYCLYFNIIALTRKLGRIWADVFAPFDLMPL